jgi:hypothetical protein
MQLYGDKEYVAFAPDQGRLMYPLGGRDANKSLVNDAVDPNIEKFPLFGQAQGVRFQLHPGETLFAPAGWWHTAGVHRDAQRGAGDLGPVRAVVDRAPDVIPARPGNYRGGMGLRFQFLPPYSHERHLSHENY